VSVVTLKCPTCGTEQVVDPDRRGPDWFCSNEGCDFPLFWAPRPPEWVTGDEETDVATLRRRPGAEGRATLAGKACPHCNEINDFAAETCWRCDRSMELVEVEVAEVEVEPIFEEEPEPELLPEPTRDWRPWVLALVVLLILVTIAVLLLV
jgi:ssDNA-binding Zn-finger/Zn-ribbon topoisomerase 1